ncbi:hypothetical protein [Cohnella lupini]|uniref:Uncharacterized protein n=1 Tax=Cohnella lupini TaxID=1294267 RepID=A0A3D9IWB3_9BACL|nr:hypothetical protein [Cohnella lupini]RED66120.1 hypothetical protein DFP95_101618 [Cohnella lupini]
MSRIGILFVLFIIFSNQNVYADWEHRFVVYSGDLYVVTDDKIEGEKIEKKIGKVTRYSDREGTYRGNFSNVYPKGTEYYSIIGIGTGTEIAIKTENGFVKAINNGKYESINLIDDLYFWIKIIFGIAGLTIIIFIYKTLRLKQS